MDPDELLDYALGQLDRSRSVELERLLQRDPELTEQLKRLIQNLHRLLDDGRAPSSRGNPPIVSTPPSADAKLGFDAEECGP